MENLHIPITGDNKGFVNTLNDTRDKVRSTARDIEKSGMSIEQTFEKIKFAAAGALAGMSVKNLISDIIRVRGEFQRADTAIQTMLGSKEKADELLSKVRDYAKISPLEFGDITRATQMMIGFNIEADKVPGFIKAIGDVSMGESGKFNSLTLAFSQMSAAGKLMGQDLNQMINAGFNPLSVMAEKTGKSIAELKEQMSKGAITAEMVQQAFIDATSEGGKFFNMSEEAAKTISGQISMLNDALDNMYNELGKQGEGIIIGVISNVTKLVENYENVGKVLLELVSIYGSYKAAVITVTAIQGLQATGIGALTAAEAVHYGWLVLCEKAQKLLNATMLANPYVLAATAIMSVVSALVIFRSKSDEAAKSAKELEDEIKNQSGQLGENRAALQRLQNEWNKLTSDKERKKWVSDNKDEFQKLGIEVDTVKEAENVLVNNTGNVIKAMELRAKAAAYAAMATKRYQEALENREVAKNRRDNPTTGDKISGIFNTGWDFNFTKSIAQEANGAANKLYDAAIYAEREAEDFISEQQKLLKDADDLMKSSKVKSSSSGTKKDKDDKKTSKNGKNDAARMAKEAADRAAERIRLEWEIAEKTKEAQRAARESVDEAYIAGIKDDYERERAQEEFEHKKRLADIERKGEEMKKARYEANKKQWELNNKDKHYETDSAEGMKGWQGASLSGNELVSLNAELAKENAEYERAARERAESLVASHQSYTDRKLAIDKQYSEDVKRIDAEIAAAQARGDNDSVAALQRSKRQAATDRAKNQSALSLDILKESPEYIRAFEDLEQTSSETLEYLIEEFEKAKQAAAQSLDPKDLKEYTDTIQRMQDEISSRNPFKTLKKSMDDLRKSEKNVKEAKDRLNLAKQKVKAAKDEGKSIEEVKKAENEEAEAQKKYNEAQDDHLKKQKKVKDSGRDAAEVFSKIGDAMNQVSNMIPGIGGEIAGVVSDVAGLATSLITALTFTAEGATAAIRAVESASVILAVISAALQVVQGIMSLLGNKDGYENAKAQYDELIKIWDELIDKKREYLNESWGNEVKQAKKEAEELLKIQEEATRVLAQQRLDVKNGSHSMWYRMWQGSYKYNGQNWQDVAAEIEKELGVTFNGMNDMTLMTAEQLEYIKGKYSGLWAVMDSDFRDFMEKIISYGAKEEEILEDTMTRITGNNYDDIYDNFMDSLYEIADGSEDVMDDIADNWQEMINRMVVNNVVGTRVKEELKSWYEELYNLQDRYNDHQMTDSAYQQELERLRNSYNSIVTSSQQEIENFRQMGIIKTLEETAEEAKKYFEDILDSWKDTLTDMESTTEDWKNALIDQIFSDLVESTILNAPLTVAEKTYENFEKYLQDWTERYKNTVEDATLSDEERTRRLKELIDEQTSLREQQAEKSKQLAESIGKDMSEVISNSLDNLGDSLIEGLLANTEADAENAGKQIALTLIKEMLQTMLASEKYKGRMEEIRNKWQQLLNGEDVAFTMDDVLQDIANLNNDIANDESISALAQQYKELNKQVENTQTVFNDLHNTFLNTLTDMKDDAESFRKTLEQTMLKDFIDKQVLDVPITVNGMDFDDFNAYVEDWNKRYAEGVKEGNMEAVDALLDELMQVRELTLSQAEDLRKRLEDSMHELGSGFNNLRETFIKTLTNIVGDAESLGKEIGQSMMEQMLNAFVEKQYSDRINAVNEEWAKALEEGDPQRIDEIRQKVINLYETISSDRVVKQLSDDIKALTDTGTTPFDNLRSSYLAALTDMNKSTEDFTKEISQMIAQSFVDSFVLGDMFDDRIEAWKKKYKDITTDAGLSEEERMKQLRGLSEMIAAERESMQGQVSDIYKLLGINDHQDQEATMSLAEAATYDQFELYLGIATAQQIALEQGNVVRQQILSTLQTMGQITSPTNPTLLEMRNMFSTANEYLLDIKRSNREILDSFSVKIDSIIGKLKRL